MGLDMNLYKKTYVKDWDHDKTKHGIKLTPKSEKTAGIKPERICYIVEDVGYWRKANAVHQWFVDNVQDGADDCKEYFVSRGQLKDLLKLCKEVLKIAVLKKGKVQTGVQSQGGVSTPIMEEGALIVNAEEVAELLPTTEGFFFGSTDYDNYYLEDIKRTVEIIEEALAANDRADFYYSASW